MKIEYIRNYGFPKGTVVILKTPATPAEDVDDAFGQDLIDRGIAKEVKTSGKADKQAASAPVVDTPPVKVETAETLTKRWEKVAKPKVIAEAVAHGVDVNDEMTVKQIVALLVPALLAEQAAQQEPENTNPEG